MPLLELVSAFAAAGDQPEAIDALAAGVERGDRYQTLLGITGSGKSFTIAGRDRRGPAADARPRPQQEPGRPAGERVPGVLPQEPGRVLRLLLRLLPARGVPPVDRHLHREGLVDQRRDRPAPPLGHERAHVAARRDHRRLGLGDLRPRRARDVRAAVPDPRRGGGARPAGHPAPARRAPVRAQRRGLRPQQVPGARRHDRGVPRLRGAGRAHPALRRRGRAHRARSTRSPARSSRSSTGSCCSPRRTTSPTRTTCSGRSRASRPSSRSGWRGSRSEGKLLEAQRLRMRTTYDLEMLREIGSCSGIENYSRYLDGRDAGPDAVHACSTTSPTTSSCVLDESHVTVPQLHGQYEGDRSRKETLVEHGFRLPSALDNRPLRFEEFIEKVNQVVFMSATPGDVRARDVQAGRRADRAAHRARRPRGRS